MKHRYARRASAIAVVALAALLGCGGDDDDANNGAAGSGGAPITGATGGTSAGSGGAAAAATGGKGAGSGGATSAGTGGKGAGTGGATPTGTGGTGAGGSGAGGSADSDSGLPMTSGQCLPAETVDDLGPYTPKHIENGGPTGSSWVFYPEELGMGGVLHPVFNWGPGAFTGPLEYTDHLNRLASHGFVVISQPSSGDGIAEKASLDWLLEQNEKSDSMFYGKLDPKRVGAGGHSLGALTTFTMAADPRLGLYILVCGGSTSGTTGAADIHAPAIILGGDGDPGTPNFENDYKAIPTPVVFLTHADTDHIQCARNNLSPWVAFMRWQFCGETKYQPDFMEGGIYCKDPWMCKSKGF